MICNNFRRFGRLAPALRRLCVGTTRAPMRREAPMYNSSVYSDDLGFQIGFAYDMQQFPPFWSFGFRLTALVHWAHMHRPKVMYNDRGPKGPDRCPLRLLGAGRGVYRDDFEFHIGFAYDMQPFLPFRSFGSRLTAFVCWHHQGAHASPGDNVQFERLQRRPRISYRICL